MRILYFAWLREKVGTGSEEVSPPAEVATVGALMDWLAGLDAAHASAFADRSVVRVAVNQDHAGPEAAVTDADEVAFFPPVTGG